MFDYTSLPREIQGEIAGHFDESSKRVSRSLSTRWYDLKGWCNEKYIEDAYTFPILEQEVVKAYTGEPIFMLLWTDDETEDEDPNEMYLELIVLNGNQLTTATLGSVVNYNIDDWVRVEANVVTVDISTPEEGISIMFDSINEDTTYFLDPFISRSIVMERLKDCDASEPSLRRFFPWYEHDPTSLREDFQEVYGMYVLGYAAILGRADLTDFSVMYDYHEEELIKVFEEVEKM